MDMDLKDVELQDFAMEEDEFILSLFEGQVGEVNCPSKAIYRGGKMKGFVSGRMRTSRFPNPKVSSKEYWEIWSERALEASFSGGGDFSSQRFKSKSILLNWVSPGSLSGAQAAGALRITEAEAWMFRWKRWKVPLVVEGLW